MKWTTKKTEKQKEIDIIEAAIVSAAWLCFLGYGCIIESLFVIVTDFIVTGVILYNSYKMSEARKRLERYRTGIKDIVDCYEGGHNEDS